MAVSPLLSQYLTSLLPSSQPSSELTPLFKSELTQSLHTAFIRVFIRAYTEPSSELTPFHSHHCSLRLDITSAAGLVHHFGTGLVYRLLGPSITKPITISDLSRSVGSGRLHEIPNLMELL
ncbi:hypothetical protein TEA_002962 [Camellia sinensis var. sinensis]|uniref:Uncharacterized protein n=1 Tax=Camellia sinensis var. sinensis TaxID=542762 RepID=A0A4S4DAF0_CAMSN|nr:hypothetical protein TEA_002962 [Camellia sinensis var. sinensis]